MQPKKPTASAVTGLLLLTGLMPALAQEPRPQQPPREGRVHERRIVVDSLKNHEEASRLARQIVSETYRQYPQQSGQPTIIINNILLSTEAATQPKTAKDKARRGNDDRRDDSRTEQEGNDRDGKRRRDDSNDGRRNLVQGDSRRSDDNRRQDDLSWKERFGERPARTSGMWVIPVVGVHASGFEADFNNDRLTGRTGWNAGLDLRLHKRGFFLQPGLHYFNTSLKVDSRDSLQNVNLLNGPRIHSLKAPLLAGLYLTSPRQGFFKLNVKGGVVGNYVLGVDSNETPNYTIDNIERWNWGLNAGVGVELGFFTIDASHEWGMSRYFKDTGAKNNILRLTLGLKL